MEKVSFKQMKDGTKEDYELLGRYEERFVKDLPDRLLEMLKGLDSSLDGYQISRLENLADEAGLDPKFAKNLLNFIIQEVIQHHKKHQL